MADRPATPTSHATFIPELWQDQVILAATNHNRNGLADKSFDLSSRFTDGGDRMNFPIMPVMTLPQETIGNSGDSTNVTPTEKTLTITRYNRQLVQVTQSLTATSKYSVYDAYTDQVAKAASNNVNELLAALHVSAGLTVSGTTGSLITLSQIDEAALKLDIANAPDEGRYLSVDSKNYNAITNFTETVNKDYYDSTEGVIRTRQVPMIKGFEVVRNTTLDATTDGFRHCLAGVYGPDANTCSLVHAFATPEAPRSNVAYQDVPALGMRVYVNYDSKTDSEYLTYTQYFGVLALRSEWLVDIKTAD